MKMLINKNILLEGLNFVSKALSSRNIIPVLNGIKFDLKKEGLYLTATDNDLPYIIIHPSSSIALISFLSIKY